MPDFYFNLFLMRLDADEKLQYVQLPYIPCLMVSGNEIKLCLKYFCLPIYFVHFEISLTFFRICMSLITLQATCRFTFNKSGYIFPYVDSVYYTQLSRE
jgi:hypothetical protein